MVLQHVGLVCRSEQACDRFYGDLLGAGQSADQNGSGRFGQTDIQSGSGV